MHLGLLLTPRNIRGTAIIINLRLPLGYHSPLGDYIVPVSVFYVQFTG